MHMHLAGFTLAILATLLPIQASADGQADHIRTQLEKNNPKLRIKHVQPSPVEGLYEVFANGNLLYVDKAGKYVLAGATLVEDASKRNLSAERMKDLTRIQFDTLPIKDAIEIRKGNGSYRFAVFTDPDCPFCQKMEQGLHKLGITDYTAYVFLFPLDELHPQARAKAESIWCASDRAAAWNNWILESRLSENTTCETPINRISALAAELGVAATPTIYLESGDQTNSPQELVEAIKAKQQSRN